MPLGEGGNTVVRRRRVWGRSQHQRAAHLRPRFPPPHAPRAPRRYLDLVIPLVSPGDSLMTSETLLSALDRNRASFPSHVPGSGGCRRAENGCIKNAVTSRLAIRRKKKSNVALLQTAYFQLVHLFFMFSVAFPWIMCIVFCPRLIYTSFIFSLCSPLLLLQIMCCFRLHLLIRFTSPLLSLFRLSNTTTYCRIVKKEKKIVGGTRDAVIVSAIAIWTWC